MSHLLSNELGQAIINYLGTQPYAQVSPLIQGMQQMHEINDEELGEYLAMKTAGVGNEDTPEVPEVPDAD